MTRDEYVRRIYQARYEIIRVRAVDLDDVVIHLHPKDYADLRTEEWDPRGPDIFYAVGDGVLRTVMGLPFERDPSVAIGDIVLRWEVHA